MPLVWESRRIYELLSSVARRIIKSVVLIPQLIAKTIITGGSKQTTNPSLYRWIAFGSNPSQGTRNPSSSLPHMRLTTAFSCVALAVVCVLSGHVSGAVANPTPLSPHGEWYPLSPSPSSSKRDVSEDNVWLEIVNNR